MAESFLGFLWLANSKSFESNSACLSGQHTIQWRSWQSQTHSLRNTRQKGNSMLVTRLDLNVWWTNRGFLYHSSAIWPFIFILLSHSMTSVENPVSSPLPCGSQCSAMCPVVLIPGHTPAGWICALWRNMGFELVPPESVQLLAQVVKEVE